MFDNFLKVHENSFSLPFRNGLWYSWDQDEYAEFLLEFCKRLEPRSFLKDEPIIQSGKNVQEVVFLMDGHVLADEVKVKKKNAIVGLEMLFEIPAQFNYRTGSSAATGFAMRHVNW